MDDLKKIKLRERSLKRQLHLKERLLKKQNLNTKKPSDMKIIKKMKSSKMKLWNIWKWPSSLIEDYRQWRIVKSALKEPAVIDKLAKFKYELRVDKLARIYTVINIPEELYPLDKKDMVWPWMLEQLREIDDLLMELRLNELVFPIVEPYPGQPAYVVKLVSSSESLSIWKFLRWLFNITFVGFSIYIINAILIKYLGFSIIEFFTSLF